MRIFQKLLIILFFIGVSISMAMAQTLSKNPNHISEKITAPEELEDLLTELLNSGVSSSILISRQNEILLKKGIGLANRKDDSRNDLHTAFDIGSIAKTFTAAAILKLQEQGKLKLTDTIDKYLENVPAEKNEITIHQLLTHSSGLENYHAENDFEKMDRDKAVKKSLALKLRFKPQTDWDYSNAGYALLGAIVEIVSGKSFQQYVWTNIIDPLELRETSWFGENRMDIKFARGYDGKKDKGSPPEWNLTWALIGGGGMYSTIEDLYKWQKTLFKGDFLNEESKKQILTPLFKRWTAGWDTGNSVFGQFIEKGGSGNYGFTSLIRYYPKEDLTIIVIFNSYHKKAEYKTHIFAMKVIENILFK